MWLQYNRRWGGHRSIEGGTQGLASEGAQGLTHLALVSPASENPGCDASWLWCQQAAWTVHALERWQLVQGHAPAPPVCRQRAPQPAGR